VHLLHIVQFQASYDIYVRYIKPIKDFKKARIRHSLSEMKPKSTYNLVNRKITYQDMKNYLLKLSTSSDVYINTIKPLHNFVIPNKQPKPKPNKTNDSIETIKPTSKAMYTNIPNELLNELLNGDIKSGVYVIDTNQGHYKVGSSQNVLDRLQDHNTSLAVINIHLIIYTTKYRLLESVILTNLEEYKLYKTKEFINGDKITLKKLIDNVIECANILKLEYTILKGS